MTTQDDGPAAVRQDDSGAGGTNEGTGGIVTATPLNVLDELYLHLDRPDEPWSVHLEVRVAGRLERNALEDAVRRAAAVHPLARARLAPSRGTDVRYSWEIADGLVELDLSELDVSTSAELDVARAALLSRIPDLTQPGPFALLLAHRAGNQDDDGDVLVLNLHHAAGDGVSALRFVTSIARAYAGVADETPAVDPLAVRDVGALAAPTSFKERLTRSAEALTFLGRGLDAPDRITAEGAVDAPGYGVVSTVLDADATRRLADKRQGGATVNDVLLAALAVTIRRWNEARRLSETAGRSLFLMMPVNLRPKAWQYDVLGNFASYVSVRFGADDQGDLAHAVPAAATATRRIKDNGVPGMIVDLVYAPTQLPTVVKQRLQELMPFVGDVLVDSAVLSNLGRVHALPGFGDGGEVQEVYFSPPGRMPLGASFGVATVGGKLSVTLRHRPPLLDGEAAERFLRLFTEVLSED